MIIFDSEKYLKDIKNNGINANDTNAKFKLNFLLGDLIENTKYKKGKIIDIVKNIAENYFDGLPDNIIIDQISTLYKEALNQKHSYYKKTITLYESEMKTIAELKDDKLMRLAFAALIVHKFNGQYEENGIIKHYASIKEADSDIYRIAELDGISGTTKLKLWNQLTEKGLVKYFVKTNPTFKFNLSWISMTMFSVLFNADLQRDSEKKIYTKISNYDDILDYLYYWIHPYKFRNCCDCGRPIKRENKAQIFCADCAAHRKKESDKRRYLRLQTV